MPAIQWHAQEYEQVLETLGVSQHTGLDEGVALQRFDADGPNRLADTKKASSWMIFAQQFNNSLVWVLLVAASISGLVLQEWVDTSVIMAIVILNALLGYVQESRAEHALVALVAMTAPEAHVRRSGIEQIIDASRLVVGDIVILEAGDKIPADLRLLQVIHLQVDESSLTGESFGVSKTSGVLDQNLSVADRKNMAFSGTTVSAGRGVGVVTATGADTEFGKVAELLDVDEPLTPLAVELDRVGKLIAVAALLIAVVIFGLGISRSIAAETMFLTAVALAVAAIPEGLSAVVTVTLSRGVSVMAEHSAIVRRLPAVEALGATTVICTDKTGTLTRNKIRVQEIQMGDLYLTDIEAVDDQRVARFVQIASLCNNALPALGDVDVIGDPLEVALLDAVVPVLDSLEEIRSTHPRLDEAAFDSSRKRMSTLHREGSGYVLLTKGAPEVILDRCSFFEDVDGPQPITAEQRGAVTNTAVGFASRGLRTLALAYREFDDLPLELEAGEHAMTLVGIVGMSDETRAEAFGAVAVAHKAGIEVVMITGDHQVTADAVARSLGVSDSDRQLMSGSELRHRNLDELSADIDAYRVFARVDPVDKVAIVQAWQSRGAIVAMTGDGVNDAPALRTADIGISMGSGTAVAREASDMVLADDNFATIVRAVEHGRAIFANLRNVVYFLLSANASEVLVMLFGFALFGSLGEPLLATQLLWINLVTDGLPALALGVDPAAPGIMDSRPDAGHEILGRSRRLILVWQGAVLAFAALLAFVYGYFLRDLEFEQARTLLFTTLVSVQMMHTFNIRAEGSSLRRSGLFSNRLLLGALTLSLLLHLGVIYTPVGNELFETTSIELFDWFAIGGLMVLAFVTVAWFNRTLFGSQRRSALSNSHEVQAGA